MPNQHHLNCICEGKKQTDKQIFRGKKISQPNKHSQIGKFRTENEKNKHQFRMKNEQHNLKFMHSQEKFVVHSEK
jgi:hypothetical protein